MSATSRDCIDSSRRTPPLDLNLAGFKERPLNPQRHSGSSDSDTASSGGTTPNAPLTPETSACDISASAHVPSLRGMMPFHLSPPTSPSADDTLKDGITPRAELRQPLWPLTTAPQAEPRHLVLDRIMTSGAPSASRAALAASLDMGREDSSLGRQLETPSGKARPVSPPWRQHPKAATSRPESPTASGTGCSISGPISPPAHYPIPTSASSSSSDQHTSTTSSGPPSTPSSPTPPRWACPPTRTSGRAKSFGAIAERPDLDSDLFEGDDEVEVIKGTEGRIAVRSTTTVYEIMVWLPGFTLENITIATRGTKTVHIVADQWEVGDHAQWDIKLGDDANMRSISAKFGGQDLRITVAREQQKRPPNRIRPSTSTPSTPLQEPSAFLPPTDIWANQWSPHPMSRTPRAAVPSMRTI